jgi:hypothetical protein
MRSSIRSISSRGRSPCGSKSCTSREFARLNFILGCTLKCYCPWTNQWHRGHGPTGSYRPRRQDNTASHPSRPVWRRTRGRKRCCVLVQRCGRVYYRPSDRGRWRRLPFPVFDAAVSPSCARSKQCQAVNCVSFVNDGVPCIQERFNESSYLLGKSRVLTMPGRSI